MRVNLNHTHYLIQINANRLVMPWVLLNYLFIPYNKDFSKHYNLF